jgi:hypothetical protein
MKKEIKIGQLWSTSSGAEAIYAIVYTKKKHEYGLHWVFLNRKPREISFTNWQKFIGQSDFVSDDWFEENKLVADVG